MMQNSKFFYEFNIDTTDDACTVPETETYSFSLTGDDASKLSSATGNDSDAHYIYLILFLIMKIHQIPIQIMFTMSKCYLGRLHRELSMIFMTKLSKFTITTYLKILLSFFISVFLISIIYYKKQDYDPNVSNYIVLIKLKMMAMRIQQYMAYYLTHSDGIEIKGSPRIYI